MGLMSVKFWRGDERTDPLLRAQDAVCDRIHHLEEVVYKETLINGLREGMTLEEAEERAGKRAGGPTGIVKASKLMSLEACCALLGYDVEEWSEAIRTTGWCPGVQLVEVSSITRPFGEE